jgi:hypothetical protein
VRYEVSHGRVTEDLVLLGRDVVSLGVYLMTFQRHYPLNSEAL